MKKLAFVLYFCTEVGGLVHVWKKTCLFCVMGMAPESLVRYWLVLSYFLIGFLPDQTQYCPAGALSGFSCKTLFYLCESGEG